MGKCIDKKGCGILISYIPGTSIKYVTKIKFTNSAHPITLEDVVIMQQQVNSSLPDDCVSLMFKHNGGHTHKTIYRGETDELAISFLQELRSD